MNASEFHILREQIGNCQWKLSPKCTDSPDHVHHIDSNAENNSNDNLAVLCVACHMYHYHKGNKLSDDTKRKISDANTGHRHTDDAKKKMSIAAIGRKHSADTIEQVANKLRGKKRTPEQCRMQKIRAIQRRIKEGTLRMKYLRNLKAEREEGTSIPFLHILADDLDNDVLQSVCGEAVFNAREPEIEIVELPLMNEPKYCQMCMRIKENQNV